jgi:hypothetical protein
MAKSKRSGIVPRMPNNRLSPAKRHHEPDDGSTGPTLETLMRTAERLGKSVYCDVKTRKVVMDGNSQAASSALSVLRDRGKITDDQHKAGQLYGYYHRVVYGRITPKPSAFSRWITDDQGYVSRSGGDPDDMEALQIECAAAFDRADAALQKPMHRKLVRLVCLDGFAPSNLNEQRALVHGLNALIKTWKLGVSRTYRS